MGERSRFLKVRLSESEYRDLRRRADEAGVTMSEHVRGAVTTVHETVDVVSALGELHHQLGQLTTDSRSGHEPHAPSQHEMLLLLRELAAARDAQILIRVRSQLAARGLSGDAAGGAL